MVNHSDGVIQSDASLCCLVKCVQIFYVVACYSLCCFVFNCFVFRFCGLVVHVCLFFCCHKEKALSCVGETEESWSTDRVASLASKPECSAPKNGFHKTAGISKTAGGRFTAGAIVKEFIHVTLISSQVISH